jgi:hypothetical protein
VLDQGLAGLAAGVKLAVGVLALADVGPQLLCLEGLRRWSQSTALEKEMKERDMRRKSELEVLTLANVGPPLLCLGDWEARWVYSSAFDQEMPQNEHG